MSSDVNYVRQEETKGASFLKTATVLALLGGMAAVYANMNNSGTI